MPGIVVLLVLLLALPAPALAAPRAELPRGGHVLLPDFRLVGLYGRPGVPALGGLGQGSAAQVTERLRLLAARFDRGHRPALPVLHLLVSVAQPRAGRTASRQRASPLYVEKWLRIARRARALLVLEVQGGGTSFLEEALAFRQFLAEPDVGLGLDPEWRVRPGRVPGRGVGSVSGREVRQVAAELDDLVRRHALPEKLLVVHRFQVPMLRDEAALPDRLGVRLLIDVDAIGHPAAKRFTYETLAARLPYLPHGLMLFPRLEGGVMDPAAVLRLEPEPDLVTVQ